MLLLIGMGINQYYSDAPEPSHWHNWFHYRNALCMTIYLTIGYYLKKYNIVERYGSSISITYIVLFCVTYLMVILEQPYSQYFAAPGYTHYLTPSLTKANGMFLIPAYLFYCTTGSIMTFWFCQKIRKMRVLEYLGRISIVVYCVHFAFLTVFISLLSKYIPTNSVVETGCFFAVIALLTLVGCAAAGRLIERRPFSYLIGKF